MNLVDTLLKGRPDGLRARLRRRLGLAPAPASDPVAPPRTGAPAAARRSDAPASSVGESALGLDREAPKDVTPPDGYEVVLHKDALADGRIIEVIVGGTAIAVARVGGEHYALANACAHAGGPLGEGQLDGHTVTCPYHGWQYDVRTGACTTVPGTQVRAYPTRVVGAAVCVKL